MDIKDDTRLYLHCKLIFSNNRGPNAIDLILVVIGDDIEICSYNEDNENKSVAYLGNDFYSFTATHAGKKEIRVLKITKEEFSKILLSYINPTFTLDPSHYYVIDDNTGNPVLFNIVNELEIRDDEEEVKLTFMYKVKSLINKCLSFIK